MNHVLCSGALELARLARADSDSTVRTSSDTKRTSSSEVPPTISLSVPRSATIAQGESYR